MYRTFLARSPCEKIVSFFPNSVTFRAIPVESRKSWALKAALRLAFGRFEAFVCTTATPSLAAIVTRVGESTNGMEKCAHLNRYRLLPYLACRRPAGLLSLSVDT